jgi:hypothetical protein
MGMNISKNNKRISMKKIFYLGLILLVVRSSSEAQGFGGIIKRAADTSVIKSKILAQDFYKTTFLDIFETDFEQELNYYDAQKACTNLGENWRLPTLDELEVIFKNSKDYYTPNFNNNFANTYYWTSTEYNKFNAWVLLPKYSSAFSKEFFGKSNTFNVRAVKFFTFDVLIENPNIRLKYSDINSLVIGLGNGWRIPSKYELRMLEKDSKLKIGDYNKVNPVDDYFFLGEDFDKNSKLYKKIILIREVKS